MTEAQCESCNELHAEDELHMEEKPGATLAFCTDCQKEHREPWL